MILDESGEIPARLNQTEAHFVDDKDMRLDERGEIASQYTRTKGLFSRRVNETVCNEISDSDQISMFYTPEEISGIIADACKLPKKNKHAQAAQPAETPVLSISSTEEQSAEELA